VSVHVVVDVGNTRIKWGLCRADTVTEVAALPPDDPAAWQRQFDAWRLGAAQTWVVSGVHPVRRDTFIAWLGQHRAGVRRLDTFDALPLVVEVDQPDKVGIDRLLNAVAANRRRPAETAAVLVDAGSAVTVDYVDRAGAFRGGAIFPGLRLMAQALHDYTALLPLVEVRTPTSPPGTSTIQAIEAGVYHAVLGGVERLIKELQQTERAAVYLTGGDAPLLAERFVGPYTLWPEMTLAGILYAV
jgi:type III pantothenate kinase